MIEQLQMVLHMIEKIDDHDIPSIHFHPFIRGQVMGAAGQAKYPRRPSPQQPFPAPPGGPQGVPRPDKIYNPFSVFWVWVPPIGGMCRKHL